MRLGVYTSCLHDRSLREALALIRELGLDGLEANAGGFIAAPHLPVDALLASAAARREYLAILEEAGVALTALNVNGNPLHPDPEVGPRHAADLRRAIELAGLLGVRRVVAMSGLPAAHPGGRVPAWVVNPWDSVYLEALDYQWDRVVVPFWREIDERAAGAGVRVCIEMHPHNVVFNPPTLERLVERTAASHIGAEMDPSHLFWQGIDPLAAVERLGARVFNAGAKDTLIHESNRAVVGVLDDRYRLPGPTEERIGLGGRYVLARRVGDPPWEFAAVGRGHDIEWWARFLAALAAVDPEMAVSIEHEDESLPGVEGLRASAAALRAAAEAAGVS
jgi:sugar phosphate isomerase/epimerase